MTLKNRPVQRSVMNVPLSFAKFFDCNRVDIQGIIIVGQENVRAYAHM